ncbi:unnamed protein product [Hanseniaspora opuntiae]
MVKTFRKPWFGIAIPCAIIGFLGYGSQLMIFNKYPLEENQRKIFNLELFALWISYYLAIITPPGSPDKETNVQQNNRYKIWNNYCEKCMCQKPERTHHCKTCNVCVLAMDHHCPWTMNCVGLYNFAPFMRFLFCILLSTSTLLWYLGKQWSMLYKLRNSYSLSLQYLDVAVLLIMSVLDFLVLFSIGALFFRCVNNEFLRGMTQIETWEMDRIETLALNDKLMPLLLMNVSSVFNVDISKNEQWAVVYYNLLKKSKRWFANDYVSFPYDNGFFENISTFMGPLYSWFIPWGKSSVNPSIGFPKNDVAKIEIEEETLPIDDNHLIDLVLSLPWPPDGLKQEKINEKTEELSRLS